MGLSSFNPDSSPDGTNPQLIAGLRYVKPQKTDEAIEFTALEFSANRLFSDTEDIAQFHTMFLNFLPRTRLFEFDHHFFFGVGLGTAIVERPRFSTLTLPLGLFTGGLQTRVKHFDVEGSVRLVAGPRRGVFDVSGTQSEVKLVYPFDY